MSGGTVGRTGVLDSPDALTVPGLEVKDTGASLIDVDDETGVVEALVSVTGVKDEVNDVIIPGAYGPTLAKRKPKGVFSHDWGRWVARTEAVEEWMPGDPRLPTQTREGKAWPSEAGGLYVRMRFNLKSREGRDAYENVKFFSETGECEWSIGYHVPDGKGVRDKMGVRHIKELDLFEYSPVLFGAAPLSGTLAVKSRLAAVATDETHEEPDNAFERLLHEEGLRDVDWDAVDDAATTLDVIDLMDPDGTKGMAAAARHRKPTMPTPAGDDREPFPIGNKSDLRDAISAYGRAKDSEKAKVKRWIIRRARALDAVGMLPDDWNVTKTVLDSIPVLDSKVAGQEASPADVRRTRQLIRWYERGGGAAQIRWGTDGDFMRCVRIAAKHMTLDQAKGFCNLRHRGATGAAPGHAPGEGKSWLIDEIVDKWTPEAEVGEYASTKALGASEPAAPGAKSYPFLSGSYEEAQDALRRALNESLLGGWVDDGEGDEGDGEDGPSRPRYREWNYVEVVGTYDDHVIARRCAYDGPNSGKNETYQLTYHANADGTVTLGDPEPVWIEVTAEVLSGGALDDDASGYDGDPDTQPGPQYIVLGALKSIEQTAIAVQVANEYAVEVKAGRVLSGANEDRLRTAVEHLVAVLRAAGVTIDVSGDSNPDALVAPTTGAPAAVGTKAANGKVVIEPDALAAALSSLRH
jgi:hypothetical protein